MDQINRVLVLTMIRGHGGRLSRTGVVDVLEPAVALSVASSMFALDLIIRLEYGTLGALVALLLLGVGTVGYRASITAWHRYKAPTLIHEFVTGSVGA